MTLALLWFLSLWFAVCLGTRLGSPCVVRRVARLVFVADDLRPPRWQCIESDGDDLDGLEEQAAEALAQRRIVPGHLHNFDEMRRAISEKGRAA